MTRGELKTLILASADANDSTVVDSTTFNAWIADAYQEAWDILIEAYEDYRVKLSGTAVISSGNTITMASTAPTGFGATDFLKVKQVERLSGSYWVPLDSFPLQESRDVPPWSYRVMDGTMYILPSSQAAGSYRMYYVYSTAALTADSSTGSTIEDTNNGLVARYIHDAVLIRLKDKCEEDTSSAHARLERTVEHMRRLGANRDGRPKRIADVRGTGYAYRTRSGIPPW
jgi:hypothetical protein